MIIGGCVLFICAVSRIISYRVPFIAIVISKIWFKELKNLMG